MQIEPYLKRIYRRHTLLLDCLVLTFSYMLALVFRYIILSGLYNKKFVRMTIYATIFIVLIALLLLITHAGKDEFKVLPLQGRAGVILDVIKIQLIMLFCIVIYLFIAGWSSYVSRTVLGLFFIINTILDSCARLWYRKRIFDKMSVSAPNGRYLMVTDDAGKEFAPRQLTISHPDMLLDVLVIDEGLNAEMAIGIEKESYIKAYIYLPSFTQNDIFKVVRQLEDRNIPSSIILTALGDRPDIRNVSDDSSFSVLNYTAMNRKGNVLGVNYMLSTISEAVFYVRHHLEKLKGQYICFSNVHTTVMAHDRSDVLEAENRSAFTFPDGAPVARVLRHKEESDAVRLAGPDFMKEMLISSMDGKTSHYFYGSSENTLKALKENIEKNYPGTDVKGYYSPPYRELTKEEEEQIIEKINAADADIIWIGLGAPRQEKWMLAHKGMFRGVMVGVGAAFDFHAGTIKRAPGWMQMLSLEWLYRLMQDPGRLFKRYFVTNIRFVWLLIANGKG